MKKDNSPARGHRDLLPDDMSTRDQLLGDIAGVYARYGYRRIETPALENIERLTRGQGGENEKLIFRILRRGLAPVVEADTPVDSLIDLGLRYDLTVPLTRFYGQHAATLPLPFRSFQFGPVWRAERPQKGRYRQFYQCDIDLIGEPGTLAEAELIEATVDALMTIGLTRVVVRVSDRRWLSALAASLGMDDAAANSFFIILDKLDKIGWDGVRKQLSELGLETNAVSRVEDTISTLSAARPEKVPHALADAVPTLDDQVIDDLSQTLRATSAIPAVADEAAAVTFDPTLVRGMGYYTGQIFEVSHADSTSSIAGGGRYDNLIGTTLGREVPACGFSIGFERIVDLISRTAAPARLALLVESGVDPVQTAALARSLRHDGRPVVVTPVRGKWSAQLSRLEAEGFTSYVRLRADSFNQNDQPEEQPLRAMHS
jgi:histidyl-tRNA synthetase